MLLTAVGAQRKRAVRRAIERLRDAGYLVYRTGTRGPWRIAGRWWTSQPGLVTAACAEAHEQQISSRRELAAFDGCAAGDVSCPRPIDTTQAHALADEGGVSMGLQEEQPPQRMEDT